MMSRGFALLAVVALGWAACRQASRAASTGGAQPATAKTASTAPEPQGKRMLVNGHRLWYRIAGHGRPVLLIPGGPGNPHDYFYPWFNRFEDVFQLIYFDAFGRGKSDRAQDHNEYSLEHDIDDVEALRTALGFDTVAMYGHSYGGIVAQGYALKYPASLSKLVLADTLHSAQMWQEGNNDTSNRQVRDQYPDVWSELQRLRLSGAKSCDASYQKVEGRVPTGLFYFYDPARAFPIDINLDVYCRIAGADADVVLGGDLASFDFRNRLQGIRVPALILTGRFDRVAIPRYALQFRALMPAAEFVMFERSGHLPFVEEPDEHDRVLRAFLSK
jgi:proline iminopeptidase